MKVIYRKNRYFLKKSHIYYLCLALWIFFSVFFGRSTLGRVWPGSIGVYTYGRYAVYAVLILLIIGTTKMRRSRFLMIAGIALVVAASILSSGEWVVLSLLLFCLA